mgnify:FL=1
MRAQQGWQAVSEDVVAALVNPLAHSREGLPRSQPATDGTAITDAEIELARLQSAGEYGIDNWSACLPAFRAALKMRARVIAEEKCDAVELAKRAMEQAEASVIDAEVRGNRAQITRAENLRDEAFDVARMTEAYWRKREAWLLGIETALYELRPRELLSAIIHARVPN